jgi:hypothetical protein
MAEMTQEIAMRILNGRKIVNNTGKYQVKVVNVHAYEDKHIVNVGAMNMFQAKQAREDLIEGEYQKATNSNLSLSIFEGNKLPAKGEIINVFADNVPLKEGGTALLLTSWSEIQVNTEVVSFDFTAEAQAKEELVTSESEFEAAK